ncbi:cyclic nucleotide-gated ion channel 1-like [Alnus glutinosa]|uniref:cyclic nucleotide-gated ion channel 1-like n=1 Tax=Alnus glutinosa TaxID=3517 RepID=UPI002D77FBCE|nr:cyclic nucleotide-gated ion channel 1-like [Alnus glutinosa]
MQMANEKAQKMRLIKTKIESWMATNQLPDNMKESIITCIRDGPEENKDFDMDNPISYISKDAKLMTEIKRHLCSLALLKVGQILNNKSEYLLQLICEYLKPLYYNENSYIFREGEPLNAMIFITQGSLWCFKTNNCENGEGTASSPQCIEKGEFYGEELLQWGFNCSPSPKLSNLPISKTVKTLTKVEAFALTANDWKFLLSTAKVSGPSQSTSWRYYIHEDRFATMETLLQAQTMKNDTLEQHLEAIRTSIGVLHASPGVQQSSSVNGGSTSFVSSAPAVNATTISPLSPIGR